MEAVDSQRVRFQFQFANDTRCHHGFVALSSNSVTTCLEISAHFIFRESRLTEISDIKEKDT